MFITSRYTEATSPVSAVSSLLHPPLRDPDNSYSSAVKNKGAWFLLAPIAGIGGYRNPSSCHQNQFGWLLDIERCDFLHARDVLSHRYQLLVILYTINDDGPELVQFFLLAGILGRHFQQCSLKFNLHGFLLMYTGCIIILWIDICKKVVTSLAPEAVTYQVQKIPVKMRLVLKDTGTGHEHHYPLCSFPTLAPKGYPRAIETYGLPPCP